MAEFENTIHNEMCKLAAQYLNGLAVAIFVILGLTGFLEAHMKPGDSTAELLDATPSYFLGAALSLIFHFFAQIALRCIK